MNKKDQDRNNVRYWGLLASLRTERSDATFGAFCDRRVQRLRSCSHLSATRASALLSQRKRERKRVECGFKSEESCFRNQTVFCLKTYSYPSSLCPFSWTFGRGEAVIPNRSFLSSVSSQKESVLPSACSLLSNKGRRGCRLILPHLPHLASDAQTRSQTQSQRPKGVVLGRAVRRSTRFAPCRASLSPLDAKRSTRDATRSEANLRRFASPQSRNGSSRPDRTTDRRCVEKERKSPKI